MTEGNSSDHDSSSESPSSDSSSASESSADSAERGDLQSTGGEGSPEGDDATGEASASEGSEAGSAEEGEQRSVEGIGRDGELPTEPPEGDQLIVVQDQATASDSQLPTEPVEAQPTQTGAEGSPEIDPGGGDATSGTEHTEQQADETGGDTDSSQTTAEGLDDAEREALGDVVAELAQTIAEQAAVLRAAGIESDGRALTGGTRDVEIAIKSIDSQLGQDFVSEYNNTYMASIGNLAAGADSPVGDEAVSEAGSSIGEAAGEAYAQMQAVDPDASAAFMSTINEFASQQSDSFRDAFGPAFGRTAFSP